MVRRDNVKLERASPAVNPMTMYKILPLSLLVFAVLLTGCTQTKQVAYEPSENISFGELNEALEGRSVDIQLNDQRKIASTALRIQPDTTWAIDLLSGQVRSAATNEINFISRKHTGRGAWQGAVLGAAGGALVGLAAGLALTSVRDADRAQTGIGQYVGVVTGFGVILGIGSGAFIGMKKGSHDRYVYPQLPMNVQAEPLPGQPTAERRTNQ